MRSSIFKATTLAIAAFGLDRAAANPIQDQSSDPSQQLGSPGFGGTIPPFLPIPSNPDEVFKTIITTKTVTSKTLVTRTQDTPITTAPPASSVPREARESLSEEPRNYLKLGTLIDSLTFEAWEHTCEVWGWLVSGYLPDPPYDNTRHPIPVDFRLTAQDPEGMASIICRRSKAHSPPVPYFKYISTMDQKFDLVVHTNTTGLCILGGVNDYGDGCPWDYHDVRDPINPDDPTSGSSCGFDWVSVKTWFLSPEDRSVDYRHGPQSTVLYSPRGRPYRPS